jgi:hypothetical protein
VTHPDARISAAIEAAYRTHPYYATAIGRLRIIPDAKVATMATSAQWVTHYNPEIVSVWTTDETAAVIVHELEHLLRRHSEREHGRDHGQWNRAADAEINERLPGLPEGCVYPETLGMPRGMTAETYYGATSKPQPEPEPTPGDGDGGGAAGPSSPGAGQPGQPGPGLPGECGSAAGGPIQEHERDDANHPGAGALDGGDETRRETAEAVIAHIGMGDDDANVLREWALAELGIDRSAWYSALAAAVGHSMAPFGAPTRWRWPGRRDMRDMGGAMVPRWTGERPSCAVVIDTSGSITGLDLDMAKAAAHYIGRMADCKFYSCNTEATYLGTSLPESLYGNGGTRLRNGIDMAIRDGAKAVVVITDMMSPWGQTEPSVPVIVGANPTASKYVLGDSPVNSGRWPVPEWMTVIPIVSE